MAARLPANEATRIDALRRYDLLDTPPEESFDEIATLAARMYRTPIALVSLVDERRQWFKARVGLAATETPREHAFCAHAILDRDVLVVEDAATDARFSRNPLVTSAPNIRFYAGAPLVDGDGHALGTLCIIDREPREPGSDELRGLQVLARQVLAQMELRRTAKELASAVGTARALSKLLPMCAWCKSIRNDDGYWQEVERYLLTTHQTQTSHGICPTCSASLTQN